MLGFRVWKRKHQGALHKVAHGRAAPAKRVPWGSAATPASVTPRGTSAPSLQTQ